MDESSSWDDFPFPTVSGKSCFNSWFQSPPTSNDMSMTHWTWSGCVWKFCAPRNWQKHTKSKGCEELEKLSGYSCHWLIKWINRCFSSFNKIHGFSIRIIPTMKIIRQIPYGSTPISVPWKTAPWESSHDSGTRRHSAPAKGGRMTCFVFGPILDMECRKKTWKTWGPLENGNYN